MFSMGGGPGGITGGPSSMASNAAAGLPAADMLIWITVLWLRSAVLQATVAELPGLVL